MSTSSDPDGHGLAWDGIASNRHARPDPCVGEPGDAAIDEALIESFPASDPPSWAPPVRIGSPRREPDATSSEQRLCT